MQYVPYHFVPVESKQGHFDSFCIARWRMDVQRDPPNLKKEQSKRLGTFSMLFELVENEWLIFNFKKILNTKEKFPQLWLYIERRIKLPLGLSAKDDS